MRFLVDGEFNNGTLLKLILFCALVYLTLMSITNALLFIDKTGLSAQSVAEAYLGSDELFRNPASYRGLLEGAHMHLFAVGIALLLVNHLTVFTGLKQGIKLTLIITSFSSGLVDMASGWLIRFVSPAFAYLKIAAFVTFELSFFCLLAASFVSLTLYDKKRP